MCHQVTSAGKWFSFSLSCQHWKGIQLQQPEHNTAYKHGRHSLQHPTHTLIVTFTLTWWLIMHTWTQFHFKYMRTLLTLTHCVVYTLYFCTSWYQAIPHHSLSGFMILICFSHSCLSYSFLPILVHAVCPSSDHDYLYLDYDFVSGFVFLYKFYK